MNQIKNGYISHVRLKQNDHVHSSHSGRHNFRARRRNALKNKKKKKPQNITKKMKILRPKLKPIRNILCKKFCVQYKSPAENESSKMKRD